MEKTLPIDEDLLREIGNIGTGYASTALYQLLGKVVDMATPHVDIVDMEDIMSIIEKFDLENKLVVKLYAKLKGDVSGIVFIGFSKRSALIFTELLEKQGKTLSDIAEILINSYVEALRKFLKLTILVEKPKIIATSGDLLAEFLSNLIEEKTCIFVRSRFKVEGVGINGDFYIVIGLSKAKKVVEAAEELY